MTNEMNGQWRALTLLTLLAVAPYLNAMVATFALDDIPTIRENPAVTGGVDPVKIFATPLPPMNNLYRPFTVLTYALNEWLAPGYAPLFHAMNILLHAGVTLLVFYMGTQLFHSERVALIAAALFAVHPIHTEAVTNVVGRAELLVAFFGLIAIWTATRIDQATRLSRWVFQAISVTSYAAALLSKESAVALLPLILLFRIVCRKEPLLQGLMRELRTLSWVPYALCTLLYVLLRYQVIGVVALGSNLTPLDNALGFVPWDVRVRSALGVIWDYFGLLNVPLVLSADYSYHQVPLVTSWLDPRFLGGVALLVIAATTLFRRTLSAVAFAVIFPVIALSVTTNLLIPIGTIKAERLLYLPSIGWLFVAAYAVDQLLRIQRYRALATIFMALVIAFFGARTWARNWDWKDYPTLMERTAYTAPDSAKAQFNFGLVLQQRGAHAAAERQFRRAMDIMARDEGSALGIGTGLEYQGFTDEALPWYRKALEISPQWVLAHRNLCRLLLITHQLPAAEAACRNGLRYNPTDSELLKGLGAAFVARGETDKGIDVLQRSLLLNRNDSELRIYVARLETTAGKPIVCQ